MNNKVKLILDNHEKLISMISAKSLPFKEVLLNNIHEVRNILEMPSKKGKSSETK